jgi:hypothetical protein
MKSASGIRSSTQGVTEQHRDPNNLSASDGSFKL